MNRSIMSSARWPVRLRPYLHRSILILSVLTLCLASCAPTKRVDISTIDTSGPPVNGDWVVIHSLSDPENLNPLTSSDAGAQEIDNYIYETLITTDPFTLQTIPWIADSLPVVGPGNLYYDFNLKKNVTFSDGKPVTGADFIFYLKALKNPMVINAAPTRGYYERVDSALLIDGDPYRLRVVMSEPYYLGDQWAGGLYAMPKHIWDPKGLTDRISFVELNKADTVNPAIAEFATSFADVEKGMSAQYIIGSGPYRFSEWRRNDRVVLERNRTYWNNSDSLGRAYPERLMWSTISDYNAALVSLRGGDLDVMPKMEKVQYVRVKPVFQDIYLKPTEYDYPAYSYIGYNGKRPIFSDPAVRRAMAYAINRDAIIEKIYFGMARPVQSPIFYKRPECDTTLPVIKYNLDSARKILADAGWTDSDGDGVLDKVLDGKKTPFRFAVLLNQGNQARQQMAILFVSELQKIGIDASTSTLDWSTFLKNTREGEYDAYIGGWVMGVTEGDMYQIWHSKSAEKGGSNYVQFRNPRVDELIQQIRGTFLFEERQKLYNEIQKIIHDEQPYNFLVSARETGAYSDRFQNVEFYAPRPCYNAGWWWSPKEAQRYGMQSAPVAAAMR